MTIFFNKFVDVCLFEWRVAVTGLPESGWSFRSKFPLIFSPNDAWYLCLQYLHQDKPANSDGSFIFVRQNLNNFSLFDVL
jgi:hypothetical protein